MLYVVRLSFLNVGLGLRFLREVPLEPSANLNSRYFVYNFLTPASAFEFLCIARQSNIPIMEIDCYTFQEGQRDFH